MSKILEGFGRRAQYSIFECDLDPNKLERLEKLLSRAINEEEDEVRLYPLDEGEVRKIRLLGRAILDRPRSAYMV